MKFLLNKLLRPVQILIIFSCLVFSGVTVSADDSSLITGFWKQSGENSQVIKQLSLQKVGASLKTRVINLDEIGFESILNAKTELADTSSITGNITASSKVFSGKTMIELPLPDGSEVSVEITPSSVMSEALAKQFPKIKTWDVKGVNEDITGTIDFTHKGFHGMLVMPDGDTVYIEPDFDTTNDEFTSESQYISFSKKDNVENFTSEFSCGVHDDDDFLVNFAAKSNLSAKSAADIITYRLAVAATGEYSEFHGGARGARTSTTLSAITTTISRINQIFKRDLGIVFELVEEQADIIYLDPDKDPYTNSDIGQLIYENDENLSAGGALSKTQYDIGHVFGSGDVGGLALVGGICNDDEKAIGATGISNPSGDLFVLDYVAHELGHQLGATHTFNSVCGGGQRTSATAVEPGSGSTIMSYAGVCSSDNLQSEVDAQLHITSILQIMGLTGSESLSGCGVRTSAANENPIIDAGENAVVPANTPLVLVAVGSDDDIDDELNYSWEQIDAGTASSVDVDTGDNAIFRSLPLTTDHVRFIPDLNSLFTNTSSVGESLPTTNRNINMAAAIRDGNGGLEYDLLKLEVYDTGETFDFVSHTVDQWLGRQDTTNIVWNVAGTDSSPISCASVDIGLVTVDGQGFDLVSTDNDGSEVVTIPNDAPAMENARFIISCVSNNFFNVSTAEITILDQIGGGYGGNEIETETDTETFGTSGGGAFNLFILLCLIALTVFRKFKLSMVNVFLTYKNTIKISMFSLVVLLTLQACTSSSTNVDTEGNNKNLMKKEFSGRFSSEKIKQEREQYYAQKRIELRKKNATAEVRKAVQSNDIYFMSKPKNRGSSDSIPGLVEPQLEVTKCRTVPVEGMGDMLFGKNHMSYRVELLNYMREFNTLMAPYCK